MFLRQPPLPEVMNACPLPDVVEVGDSDESMDARMASMQAMNEKVSVI